MGASMAQGGKSMGKMLSGNSWFQRSVTLKARSRGCHLVTDEIVKGVPELTKFKVGIAHFLIQHTSASLLLNENWDPSVREDMEMMLNKIIPENLPYRHSCEGPDDMVSDTRNNISFRSLS
ncbi:PREDICTED: UPF0047 protein YjbQ-like [Priapulus caudatus]|uniref:UPF0047 protein YjbQ-like n=1 Tax=Priapulus caudatus TaxID=37621 RepID=A0ABM1DV76_PRICU|nr:PREDICTED: UPF0047 protein YjbQ-like [Priapulus caudatus]